MPCWRFGRWISEVADGRRIRNEKVMDMADRADAFVSDRMHGKVRISGGRRDIISDILSECGYDPPDSFGVPDPDGGYGSADSGADGSVYEGAGRSRCAGSTPEEIQATLDAAARYPHKHLWCVFQPHTYSRTRSLLPDFAHALSLAENVVLADIYAARENDPGNISSKTLQQEMEKYGKKAHYFHSFEEIEDFLYKHCTNGDLLITMGAGDVVNIGEDLLKR